MFNPTAASSDLVLGRRLSHELRGEITPNKEQQSGAKYVHFQLHRGTTLHPAAMLPVPYIAPDAGLGSEVWAVLLTWCVQVSRSSSAFVMDSHGLVVAALGTLPAETLEAAGARLVLAMDQAASLDVLGGPTGAVAVEIGDAWLTAMRVALDDGESLAVALLGGEPVAKQVRQLVHAAITARVRPQLLEPTTTSAVHAAMCRVRCARGVRQNVSAARALDHRAKTLEEIERVVGACGGFGVILHRECTCDRETFARAVVEVQVGSLALARKRTEVDREAVVLRRDLDATGAEVEHGLVDAAMAEFQLVRRRTERSCKKLVT